MVRKLVLPINIGRRVVILVALFALIPAGIISLVLFNRMSTELIDREINLLDARTQLMANDFSEKVNTLRQNTLFLAQTPPIQGIIRSSRNNGIDPNDGSTLVQWQERLTTIFQRMGDTHPDYYQFRYITLEGDGMEIIKVTNASSGQVVVPQDELQAKGDTNYFNQSTQLPQGETYLSKIELNREFGVITEPKTPVLRAATPIYDDAGEIFGIVIINLNMGEYFNRLASLADPDRHTFYMVNYENELISHPDHTKTFLFDYDNSWRIADEFPGLASTLNNQTGQNGSFWQDETELAYSFQRSSLDSRTNNVNVGMMITMDYNLITGEVKALRNQVFPLLLLLGAIAALFGVYITRPVGSYINKIQTVLEKSPDAIFLTNGSGNIEYTNTRFSEFTGYSDEEVANKQADMITADTTASDSISQAISKVEQTHAVYQSNTNGTWIELNIYPIVDTNGVNTNFVGILHDISDRMAREKSEKERIIAEEANQEKSAFLARMSHELRTPLNAIIGYGEMARDDLREELPDHPILDDMDRMQGSAKHLLSLIKDILEYSKIEKGQILMEPGMVNVREILDKVYDNVSLNIHQKGLIFSIECTKETGSVFTDPVRLSQIITNLLNNATKFTDKGWIKLSADRIMYDNRECLEICIADSGHGIPSDRMNRVFDPFVQLKHKDDKLPEGVGLGLTITKRLVEALGGKISLISEPGKGSEFTIILPVNLAEVENKA